jgi:hypothetical protein
MKVNAKVGGFNLRMAPDDYPKRWRDLIKDVEDRVVATQDGEAKVRFFPAIIMIGESQQLSFVMFCRW